MHESFAECHNALTCITVSFLLTLMVTKMQREKSILHGLYGQGGAFFFMILEQLYLLEQNLLILEVKIKAISWLVLSNNTCPHKNTP